MMIIMVGTLMSNATKGKVKRFAMLPSKIAE